MLPVIFSIWEKWQFHPKRVRTKCHGHINDKNQLKKWLKSTQSKTFPLIHKQVIISINLVAFIFTCIINRNMQICTFLYLYCWVSNEIYNLKLSTYMTEYCLNQSIYHNNQNLCLTCQCLLFGCSFFCFLWFFFSSGLLFFLLRMVRRLLPM